MIDTCHEFIPLPDRPAAAAWLGIAYLVWLLALAIGILKRLKGRDRT